METKNSDSTIYKEQLSVIKNICSFDCLSKYIVPLFIVLNLCITLPLAAILNVWTDEFYTIHTTGKSIGYAIHQALQFERLLPLYFVVLDIWRNINGSPFFARLFSILCIVLMVYVTAKLSRRFFKEINPGWMVIAVSLNPFIIWAAVEIRLYAFMILLSALLLLFFHDGYLCENPQRRSRLHYILFSVIALYTHHYFGFFLVANACALIVLKRWSSLRNYLYGMIIVGVCFLPLVPVISNQVTDVSKDTKNISYTMSAIDGLKVVYRNILTYVLPSGRPGALTVLRNWFISFAVIVALVFILKNHRRFINSHCLALMTIITVLSCFFLLASILFSKAFVELRHTSILFLPVICLLFTLISTINKQKVLIIWTLIMLFFYIITLYHNYLPMAKNGDWSRVASYLRDSEKLGQPILVFRAESALPLALHYSGSNEIVPLPKAWDLETYDLRVLALNNEEQILDAISHIQGDHQYIWLVTDNVNEWFGVNFNHQILEACIAKYFTIESCRTFYGSKVRLLRITPNIKRINLTSTALSDSSGLHARCFAGRI